MGHSGRCLRPAGHRLTAIRVKEAEEAGYEFAILEEDLADRGFSYVALGYYNRLRVDAREGNFAVGDVDGNEFGDELLSDGARRQALLAIRLGLLPHLLKGEAGFIVLDDALVTFDDEGRKERAVLLMGGL